MRDAQNLSELLLRSVAAAPEKVWLTATDNARALTYSAFVTAAQRTARLLLEQGVGQGDKVALLLPNSIEYAVAYFACWRLGAVAAPVNSLLKPQEIAYVIGNAEARTLLIHSQFLPLIADLCQTLPQLAAVIEFDDESSATKSLKSDSHELSESEIKPDDEALIIYTSGTTGKAKGCLLTHGNLLANAEQIVNWLGYTRDEHLLTMMPLFHVNAIMVGMVAPLFAGGAVTIAPKFSASKFWQWINDFGITTFGSVATMLTLLNQTYPHGAPENLDATRLRFALCGSAPVPREVLETFERLFKVLVIEGYGLSESTCRATFNPPNEKRRPGSCGLPIGNEARVVDENDIEVPTGERGEITLRGANIFKGYYKMPDATAQALRGGWLHTGDVGYRDADGFLYIADRKSDMIIRGGENIYPREIDEALYQHAAVAAAATIGVPDNLYGEKVVAFVSLKDGMNATAEDLSAHCRARLADFKCPQEFIFTEEIPKSATGKLLKRELAANYVARVGS